MPKWWLPEHFAYCDIPSDPTGEIDELALRGLLALDAAHQLISVTAEGV